ncbi:MAG: aminotransferase class I/II-fold pyridoxal phosphate-dependent enzyme [Candidatus Nitrosocaldus sp.]|nr:aminotransferase class I/II-fold pyridoxal phosphate-dependent enzyme [Candidatus Nitrosocaldus sp.]MDW8275612.1 aminotransferase class I/II-fold pyridoxal phosphate-dependent enzyme [Candidatus Nitrosocaldus sp.]
MPSSPPPSPSPSSLSISRHVAGVEYAIRDIIHYAKEQERKGNRVIYLNIGDPVLYGFGTPKHVKDAMVRAVLEDKNYYAESEGVRELREAIAERESAKGMHVVPEDVVVTNGVSEALDMIISSIAEPGDEVLVPGPCYPPYLSYARVRGVKPVEYATLEHEGWRIDMDDLRGKITGKTRAIFVINPNNPTGSILDEHTLEALVDTAVEHNLYLVCDEIYDRIVFDRFTSIGRYARDAPVVILNGFSKVYLMTGWRLGYICLNSNARSLDGLRASIGKLARLRLSANTPAQIAAIEALRGPQDHVDDMVSKLNARREYVMRRLDAMSGVNMYVKPRGAFYIFPRIDGSLGYSSDAEFVLDLLKSKNMLVVHGSGFGSMGYMHFRLVYLPSLDVLEDAMNRLEEFVGSHYR